MDDRKVSSTPAAESRRDVVRKMAYAAPLVLSLAARPAFASSGSGSCGRPSSGIHGTHANGPTAGS